MYSPGCDEDRKLTLTDIQPEEDKVHRRMDSLGDNFQFLGPNIKQEQPLDIKVEDCYSWEREVEESVSVKKEIDDTVIQNEYLSIKDEDDIEIDESADKNQLKIGPFKCSNCSYQSKRQHDLKRHMLIHEPSQDNMFKCSECSYKTNRQSDLRKHMLVHKDESETNMFQCNECGLTTKYKTCLSRHMRVHTDRSRVKMLKCSECNHKTKHQDDLQKHIMLEHKIQTETKRYKCSKCSFTTKYKTSIPRHMLVHTEPSKTKMK